MSSNSGGHAMAPGGVPGGVVAPGQGSVGPAAGVASTGASTLLWAKTQQLPEEAFRQLHSIYGDHFPIEARHHLAGKSSFLQLREYLKDLEYSPHHHLSKFDRSVFLNLRAFFFVVYIAWVFI